MKTLNLLIKDKRNYIETILKKYDYRITVIFALTCAKATNPTSKKDLECISAVEAWLENPSEENRVKCRDAYASAASAASAAYYAYAAYYAAAAYAAYAAAYAYAAYAYASASAVNTADKVGWVKMFEILGEVVNENT